jgi:hypothetical protein
MTSCRVFGHLANRVPLLCGTEDGTRLELAARHGTADSRALYASVSMLYRYLTEEPGMFCFGSGPMAHAGRLQCARARQWVVQRCAYGTDSDAELALDPAIEAILPTPLPRRGCVLCPANPFPPPSLRTGFLHC